MAEPINKDKDVAKTLVTEPLINGAQEMIIETVLNSFEDDKELGHHTLDALHCTNEAERQQHRTRIF